MQPNYEPKDWVVASKLKTFSYNNVVLYTITDKSDKNNIIIRRIVALEGDTVEIYDGYVIRNGFIADIPQKLMFNYFVKRKIVKNINVFGKLKGKPVIKGDTIILSLNYDDYVYWSREYLLRKFNYPNCCPFVVPKGHCFVLGDNRDNSINSSFSGCLPVKNVVATVIGPR
jgi:signal peptidase I